MLAHKGGERGKSYVCRWAPIELSAPLYVNERISNIGLFVKGQNWQSQKMKAYFNDKKPCASDYMFTN